MWVAHDPFDAQSGPRRALPVLAARREPASARLRTNSGTEYATNTYPYEETARGRVDERGEVPDANCATRLVERPRYAGLDVDRDDYINILLRMYFHQLIYSSGASIAPASLVWHSNLSSAK